MYENPNALLLFSPDGEFRDRCTWLRLHPRFEAFIFVCVICNGIIIGLQKPDHALQDGEKNPLSPEAATGFQLLFLSVFIAEMVVKVISMVRLLFLF